MRHDGLCGNGRFGNHHRSCRHGCRHQHHRCRYHRRLNHRSSSFRRDRGIVLHRFAHGFFNCSIGIGNCGLHIGVRHKGRARVPDTVATLLTFPATLGPSFIALSFSGLPFSNLSFGAVDIALATVSAATAATAAAATAAFFTGLGISRRCRQIQLLDIVRCSSSLGSGRALDFTCFAIAFTAAITAPALAVLATAFRALLVALVVAVIATSFGTLATTIAAAAATATALATFAAIATALAATLATFSAAFAALRAVALTRTTLGARSTGCRFAVAGRGFSCRFAFEPAHDLADDAFVTGRCSQ